MPEMMGQSDFAALWAGCGWLFRAVTENISHCVCVFDRDGRCRAANTALGRWLNRSPADLLGRTAFDLWPRSVAERDADEHQRVLHGEIIDREEERPRDGGMRRVHLRKAPLRDEQGIVHGVLCLFAKTAPERGQSTSVPSVPLAIAPSAAKKTILLIEPDVNLLLMTSRILSPHGFDVMATREGKQGIQIYRNNQTAIEAVVLEQNLPPAGPSGLETMNAMLSLNPRLRVVLMSGSGRPESSWWANTPGLGFLSKPFTPEQLVQAVREVLNTQTMASRNGPIP
jgi:PAS domain S-box-containing protein